MKKILIYNTLSREKEEFKALKAGELSFYYCGPTVYWTQHIGNLRGTFCADIVHRSFKYLNYDVRMVRNYTDVGHLSSDDDQGDDKIELAAKKLGLSPLAIADKYIKIYESDVQKINILEPLYKPRATESITEMIDIVQLLIAKGYAYSSDLAIYFDVSKFKDYTKLSGRRLEKNKSGAGQGLVQDKEKRSPYDFVLWFFRAGIHAKALQYWPSPFHSSLVEQGFGFPGWHLECSAMIRRYLGETIDIHMGGIEHVSVHHSNEIAQSEAANGVKLANYWIHNEHLLVNNSKMAKSEGTSFSLEELEEKKFSPLALRYFFLQAHYRSKQNFTFEALKAAQQGLTKLINKIKDLGLKVGEVDPSFKIQFLDYLLDDFNTPKTLSLISLVLKSELKGEDKLATLIDFDLVWGLDLDAHLKDSNSDKLSIELEKLLEERNLARVNKDFSKADDLRNKIREAGYEILDLADGQSELRKI